MSYESFAGVYDSLMKNADYELRAERIVSVLNNYGIKDGLLLDLACGTGSLSVLLSKAGYEVIGTDASPEMLMKAQQKAAASGQNILLLCQSMQETDLYGTVRAAVSTLDSLNHLPDYEALCDCFGKLKNFIEPGGLFIFDVNTVYKHRCVLGDNTFVYDENGVFCVWQNRLKADSRTVNIDLDFFVEEDKAYHRYSESFSETAFTDDEITEALHNNGFSVKERFSEDMKSPVTDETERIVYIAGRNL